MIRYHEKTVARLAARTVLRSRPSRTKCECDPGRNRIVPLGRRLPAGNRQGRRSRLQGRGADLLHLHGTGEERHVPLHLAGPLLHLGGHDRNGRGRALQHDFEELQNRPVLLYAPARHGEDRFQHRRFVLRPRSDGLHGRVSPSVGVYAGGRTVPARRMLQRKQNTNNER